jgi:hypothetical protein
MLTSPFEREERVMGIAADKKSRHYELSNVGLRAHATAVGLLQLVQELRHVGILDQPAVERIKAAIADEIEVCAPRPVMSKDYRSDVRQRLDRLFAGEEKIGSATALEFAVQHDHPG